MHIPLNTIHWYIGWPIILVIAVHSSRLRRSAPNTINTLFGLASWGFLTCLAFYALPPLLTLNSQILTLTTIIADIIQFISLAFMWIAVARIYFPGNRLASRIIGCLTIAISLIGAAISITENLTSPVTMVFVGGAWQLSFAFPVGYQVVTAIQYASLLLLAAKLWVQARDLTDRVQVLRLRSFSLAFLCVGGFYVSRPFLSLTNSQGIFTQNILLLTGIVVFAGFAAATFYIGRFRSQA